MRIGALSWGVCARAPASVVGLYGHLQVAVRSSVSCGTSFSASQDRGLVRGIATICSVRKLVARTLAK